jgi:cell division protein FtsB
MREFEVRRRFKNLLYSSWSVGALAILCVFLAQAAWGVYGKEKLSALERNQATAELATLKARKATLEAETSRLKTVEGVESEIRDKYRMVKEGEELVVIVENKDPTVLVTQKTRPWYKRIFGL